MIVAVSGRVKVTGRSAEGGELTLAIIKPGGPDRSCLPVVPDWAELPARRRR
jgi:hypothetical protein